MKSQGADCFYDAEEFSYVSEMDTYKLEAKCFTSVQSVIQSSTKNFISII